MTIESIGHDCLILFSRTRRTERLDSSIKELLRSGEGQRLEFKPGDDDPDMLGEDISALANAAALTEHEMAYMVWGIEDGTRAMPGTSLHWRKAGKGNGELEAWLRSSLSPNAGFEYGAIQLDGKWFGVLAIPAAVDRTVMFNQTEYIRIGNHTKRLDDYPQVKTGLWDRLRRRDFESRISLRDLTSGRILNLLDCPAYFSLLHRTMPEESERILACLQEDGLVLRQDDGLFSISNLGALLLARKLSGFPLVGRKAVRIAAFKGDTNLDLLKEYVIDRGYASCFEEIMLLLDALLPSRETREGALRERREEYPLVAVREAVANALVHQDLALTGAGPVIEIHSNRIEIGNPGTPLVDVRRIIDSPPRSRNGKLASLARRMRLCEGPGSGWERIASSCEEKCLPAPVIRSYDRPESTRVILYPYKPFEDMDCSERLHACYLHACLCHVSHAVMNNASLRRRFGMSGRNASRISRLLRDAISGGCIRPFDPKAAPGCLRYVPAWA